MKLLLLGIDAADLNIIQKMDMPFLNDVISKHVSVTIEEDILSRGWAEIYTGRHGVETKAFYDYPLLEQPYGVSQVFNSSMLPASIPPIWSQLSCRNYKVGVMNVPTTSPIANINGFIVGGGGGGMNKLQKIGDELCYPRDIAQWLNNREYIADLRLTTSGITDIKKFFEKFTLMVKKRTQAFIELSKKYHTDFSFIVYRALAIIQYLGMSEIEYLHQTENKPSGDPNDERSILFREELASFYRFFDTMLQKIFDTLQPERFIIVSDHAMVPYLKNVNYNEFLKKSGFLKPNEVTSSFTYQTVRQWVPKTIRNFISNRLPSNTKQLFFPFDKGKTQAFALGLINGIYINDQDRFGGPIHSNSEIKERTRMICGEFNQSREAVQNDMQARPYREMFHDAPFGAFLPDIWIDKPDTVRAIGRGEFITANDHYQHITDITEVHDDNWTGVKGRTPLFIIDNDTVKFMDDKDNKNLTMVYKIVNRLFS